MDKNQQFRGTFGPEKTIRSPDGLESVKNEIFESENLHTPRVIEIFDSRRFFENLVEQKWPWIDFSAFSWLPFFRFKAAMLAFDADSRRTFVGEADEVQKSALESLYYVEIGRPKSSKSTFYDFGARNRSKYRKIVKRPRNLLPGSFLTSRFHF